MNNEKRLKPALAGERFGPTHGFVIWLDALPKTQRHIDKMKRRAAAALEAANAQ